MNSGDSPKTLTRSISVVIICVINNNWLLSSTGPGPQPDGLTAVLPGRVTKDKPPGIDKGPAPKQAAGRAFR